MKHNPTPKILGEKLKLNVHTQPLERNSCKTIILLRKVIETDFFNIKSML